MAANTQANTSSSITGRIGSRSRQKKAECTAVTRYRYTSSTGSTKTGARFSSTYGLLLKSNATSFNLNMLEYLKQEWPLGLFILGTLLGTLIALLYI